MTWNVQFSFSHTSILCRKQLTYPGECDYEANGADVEESDEDVENAHLTAKRKYEIIWFNVVLVVYPCWQCVSNWVNKQRCCRSGQSVIGPFGFPNIVATVTSALAWQHNRDGTAHTIASPLASLVNYAGLFCHWFQFIVIGYCLFVHLV